MIFSRGLIEEYVEIEKISTEAIYKKLNTIGLEVDSLTEYKAPKGVVVGKVLECEKHPDADKLSVCKVDIGSEVVQIVCGAKNVAKDQFVPVAKIGAVIGDNESFTIKKSKLRGVDSVGMICSSTEIGLPKINDGIMVLDTSVGSLVVGQELSAMPFFNDSIFEIELTPNRGDCLNIKGVARELSASFEIPTKSSKKIEEEDNVLGIGRLIQVSYEGKSDSSLLYKVIKLSDFTLPLKYRVRLALAGALQENDIENLIEYCTMLSGVILRAYDFKAMIAKKDENFKPLLTIKRDSNTLDCVYFEEKISTIGVSQEKNYRATDTSGTIVVEASYIPPNIIASKTMQLDIEKEQKTFYRTSRGSNPKLQNGIDLLCSLVNEQAGENIIYSGTHEIIQNYKATPLSIDVDTISMIIGHRVQKSQVVSIMKNLNFKVDVSPDEQFIAITPPPFRHDISNLQDVTEEIVRIIGIDNIPSQPLSMSEQSKFNDTSKEYYKKRDLRLRSSGAGFNETIHYLFNHREKIESYALEAIDEHLEIINPITNELNTLRTTLALGLLETVQRSKNLGRRSCAFFEIGSVYNSKREERQNIAFIFSGLKEEETLINSGKSQPLSYFEFAEKVSSILGIFDLKPLESKKLKTIHHPHQSAELIYRGESIGELYKLHPTVQSELDIFETYICEVALDSLPYELKKASDYSKFQSLQRDLSLVVPNTLQFSEIRGSIDALKIPEIKSYYPLDIYRSDELGDSFSLTIRFTIQSQEQTLEDEKINSITDTILENLKEKFGAELR